MKKIFKQIKIPEDYKLKQIDMINGKKKALLTFIRIKKLQNQRR